MGDIECPTCGSSLEEEDEYCPECGAKFTEENESIERYDEFDDE